MRAARPSGAWQGITGQTERSPRVNILLLGKSGQVGIELQRALARLARVTAPDHAACDLADSSALRRTIRAARPDVIVNAAAYTAVDRAESEPAQAHAVNAAAPGILGEEAAALGAWVVHYSTDYVFDGTQARPYLEDDQPNPLNVYGASKLVGERALQASGARHLIFRTSWVVSAHGRNFVKTILERAASEASLEVVSDQWGAPTAAALIADVTARCIEALANPGSAAAGGLYHLAAGSRTTWYECACHVVELARAAGWPLALAPENIRPIPSRAWHAAARRPACSILDTRKLRAAFGLRLPDWREGVDQVVRQLLHTAPAGPKRRAGTAP
jgi:dTDP-4-dehydrorhamnose reductase